MAKKIQHKYLLYLYQQVDELVNTGDVNDDNLPHYVVSFCTVVEKIFKIQLYKKNPILVFELDWKRENNNDFLSKIALRKEDWARTSSPEDIIARFGKVYSKYFSESELDAILSIFKIRNAFVHGYKSDSEVDFDFEQTISKISTVWEKISKLAVSLFGKENIKRTNPKKKYTEKELEEVLIEEVKKMIKPIARGYSTYFEPVVTVTDGYVVSTGMRDQCPRCRSYSFSKRGELDIWSVTARNHSLYGNSIDAEDGLYKCKECNLELTEKQYDIAKRI